jgi:hypothetical protein
MVIHFVIVSTENLARAGRDADDEAARGGGAGTRLLPGLGNVHFSPGAGGSKARGGVVCFHANVRRSALLAGNGTRRKKTPRGRMGVRGSCFYVLCCPMW